MKPASDNKGIALIITLLIISIIVVISLEFNTSMRTEIHSAANSTESIRLAYIAKSGFNFALAVLREDEAEIDSLHDNWALIREYSSYSDNLFNEGMFLLEVTDLKGKIQINQLVDSSGEYNFRQKELLIRILTSNEFGFDYREAEDILDNIKDWIDEDDEPTRFGAESSYYQSLDPTYSTRNAPMQSVDEMLLIRGITGELLYGDSERPGISRYLTVYGDEGGRININTADPFIISVMSEDIDAYMVDSIIEFRENENNDLRNPRWYQEATGTGEEIIDPLLITTKSSFFEITSIGIKDHLTSGIRAVVKRDGKTFRILSWEVF